MLDYYKVLIQLRKTLPALNQLDRKNLEVEIDEGAQTLLLRRWQGGQQVICCMNFSNKEKEVKLPETGQNWFLLLASAAKAWGGTAEPAATTKGFSNILLPRRVGNALYQFAGKPKGVKCLKPFCRKLLILKGKMRPKRSTNADGP